MAGKSFDPRDNAIDLRVVPSDLGIKELATGAAARDFLQALGNEVAAEAKLRAPRDTGAGAASIHCEVVKGEGGALEARVGWDQDHFYLFFHEMGTSKHPPRPFLRPAMRL